MHNVIAALLVGLLVSFAAAQQKAVEQNDRPGHEPVGMSRDAQDVLDSAALAPSEFSADVLLILVESGFVHDRVQQRKLIEEAFQLAGYAQEQVALRSQGRGPINAAFHTLLGARLDQLSLRTRAVRAMLSNDPQAAVDLFERIGLALNTKFQCEEPRTYELSIYYGLLPDLWKCLRTSAAQQLFLQARFLDFRSSAQVEPFAGALSQLAKQPGVDPASILYSFAGRLSKLDPDSRIFTDSFRTAIPALKRLALVGPTSARVYLVQQARDWVLQASKYGICTQRPMLAMGMDGKTSRVDPVAPVELFNSELATLIEPQPRIDEQDARGELPGSAFKIDDYSKDYLRFDQMRRLLEKDEGNEKTAARWKTEIENYVTQLTEWKNPSVDDSDPTSYYLEKTDLLHRVLAIQEEPPPATLPDRENWSKYWSERSKGRKAGYMGRDRVTIALVNLFESSTGASVYGKRRSLWFAPIRELLRSPEDSPGLNALLAGSQNPVLRLYGLIAGLQAASGRGYW